MPECREAQECINKGFICVDDNIEFRTIRDISDLFNKHYAGFQRSWIKIGDTWETVASCYQLPENSLYKNYLSADGKTFYYTFKENNDTKNIEAVNGIINHEMKITYLFLKFPNANGYKFAGVFEKDIDAMKKSIENREYRVVYKRCDDKLNLKPFFYNIYKNEV